MKFSTFTSLLKTAGLLCLIWASIPTAARAQAEILIRFEPGAPADSVTALLDSLDAVELAISPITKIRKWLITDTTNVVVANNTLTFKESIKFARRRTRVKEVGPNYFIRLPEPLESFVSNIGYPLTCPLPVLAPGDSNTVVVGLLDTGIDTSHFYFDPLKYYFWENPDEIPGDMIDNDGNGFVDDIHGYDYVDSTTNPTDSSINGHGTHIAGTIIQIADTAHAPNVRIANLRIMDKFGFGELFDAILAIDYGIAKGMDILNMSIGYIDTIDHVKDSIPSPMAYAIQFAGDSVGMLVIAAAGNENMDIDEVGHYPASFPQENILSIAATDCFDERAWFSNYADTSADLGAPGVDVFSTVPLHVTPLGFQNKSGTSMAAGVVSGMAAVLATHEIKPTPPAETPNSNFHYGFIKEMVMIGCDSLVSLIDTVLVEGRINAFSSLDSMIMNFSFMSALVWDDIDGNGIQDAGEPGLPGYLVTLIDDYGNYVTDVVTDPGGFYSFFNLPPADYAIAVSGLPVGMTFSPKNRGADEALDSDVGQLSGVADLILLPPSSFYGVMHAGITMADTLLLDAQILLEGPYSSGTGLMGNDLQLNGLLPITEPYTELGFSPKIFPGDTMVHPLDTATGGGAPTDWVLVELRNADDSTEVIASRVGMVLRNGDIVAADSSGLSFGPLAPSDYFVAIRHRNHLGVMTGTALSLSSAVTVIDFKSVGTAVHGTDARLHLGGGIWGLYSGDLNGDGIVDAKDRSSAWNLRNSAGYLQGDVTLDGAINAAERSAPWNNRNKVEQVPE